MLLRCLTLLFLIVGLSVPFSPAAAQECDLSRWYCVDQLNAGLDAAPEVLDRTTPRASIESFLYFAERENWSAAAHLLDLTDIPEDERNAKGAELARQLGVIIDRKATINWGSIRDRPDGIDAAASGDLAIAGEPRKSLLLWTLDNGRQPAGIRLNRIKPEGEEAVWVFPRQTVGNIPALYDRHGPSEIEQLLPDLLKRDAAFDFMWWELLGLPILIAISITLGWMLWRLLGWMALRTGGTILSQVLRAARGPVSTGFATGFAMITGSGVFVFSGAITTILVPLAWMGVLASSMWLVVNAAEVLLDHFAKFDDADLTRRQEEHSRTMATGVAAARRILILAVSLLGTGMFLSQTNLFENLGWTLLGTAGALTLVLGFAARRVLGNIMASLQIALNQSAKIGDRIVFKDCLCHVERIHFTYVQLRDWDGTRLIVPVEEFVSTPFENWTMKELPMLRIIKLKYSHDADVDALRKLFDEAIQELDREELDDLDDAKVRVAGQDVFGKEVWFYVPCLDPNTSWDIACQAREKIIAKSNRLAKQEKIEVFPQANPAEAA